MADQDPAAERTRQVFEEVALPVLDELFRFTCRLERDPSRAADLLQDTLLVAFRKFGQLETLDAFRAWMYRIAWRTFLNRTRRRHEHPLPLADLSGPAGHALEVAALRDRGPLPDERMMARRLARELTAALDELPRPQRAAVFLIDVQEFTYAEVARMLDARPGTVASWVSRGRAALRDRLQHLARERGWIG